MLVHYQNVLRTLVFLIFYDKVLISFRSWAISSHESANGRVISTHKYMYSTFGLGSIIVLWLLLARDLELRPQRCPTCSSAACTGKSCSKYNWSQKVQEKREWTTRKTFHSWCQLGEDGSETTAKPFEAQCNCQDDCRCCKPLSCWKEWPFVLFFYLG